MEKKFWPSFQKCRFECDFPKVRNGFSDSFKQHEKSDGSTSLAYLLDRVLSKKWTYESTFTLNMVFIFFQDVDTYKSSTKDDIMNWITTLKKCGVPHDWMVILVEAPDSRKAANKLLPRASVVDKLRTDIGTKNADRCFSLLGRCQTVNGANCQSFCQSTRLDYLRAPNNSVTISNFPCRWCVFQVWIPITYYISYSVQSS